MSTPSVISLLALTSGVVAEPEPSPPKTLKLLAAARLIWSQSNAESSTAQFRSSVVAGRLMIASLTSTLKKSTVTVRPWTNDGVATKPTDTVFAVSGFSEGLPPGMLPHWEEGHVGIVP